MSVIFCVACSISHLQVTWMTGHFVSFREKHVAGEEWDLALEGWGECMEGIGVESLGKIGAKLERDFQQNKFH